MRRAWIALLATALVATACAADDDPVAVETTVAPATTAAPTTAAPTTAPSTTAAPTAEETEDTAPASGDAVTVAGSDLGDILVDADGNTLYLFTPDAQGESACYDQCEEIWPPLPGDVSAGDGVDASLLGTTQRTDGSTQATYNGWPLYHYAADGGPGDTNGQGVGDVWFVVDPAGDAVGGS